MINTIIILTVFVLILLIKNIRNSYSWLILLMVAGMDIALFAIALYISKISWYQIPKSIIFMPDYRIYIRLTSLHINYYSISRFLNIGISLFLFSIPFFIIRYTGSKYKSKYLRPSLILLTSLFPILYLICYDPETSYYFYCAISSASVTEKSRIFIFLKAIDLFSYIWIIIYLLLPIAILATRYAKSKIIFFKYRNLAFMICFAVINSFFFIVFYISPFKKLYLFSAGGMKSLVKHVDSLSIPPYFYNIIPVFMLLAIIVMIFLITNSRGIESIDIFRKIFIERNIITLNKNIRGFLHTFKNALFNIKVLSEKAEADIIEGSKESIYKIQDIVSDIISSVSKAMDSIVSLKLRSNGGNIEDCIDEALKSVKINDNIIVEKYYENCEETHTYFDAYFMKDAFINVIKNAVEAIEMKDTGKGKIVIRTASENKLIAISIRDNGVGIRRRDIKKIFNMFYSTKPGLRNWGAGLAYVQNVVKAHLGLINVYSKVGKGTVFEIILTCRR